MTVDERGGSGGREGGPNDQFPAGLRVLAVDDDPTCLKLLETLLRRCRYNVTTTNQAVMALKMLRENKDKFDLVISDVHMPDMDGFKLLELVGLEMDLPVIMLSANSDPQAVLKGITHGACDYLLKPVRLEELQNIWQHVVRRRKFDSKNQNKCYRDSDGLKPNQQNCESGQNPAINESTDQNGRHNRKRKDQNEEDEYDSEENGNENEDPSSQKKPRVVWSVDLHNKFVAAVKQLGFDKAVPKKILDLMNVENLSRENVASHLQKYRLYLKRISNVSNQQANIVAALGGKESCFPMASLDGFRNYHAFPGSGQLSRERFPGSELSFQQGAMLGRLNSPAMLGLDGLDGLASSGVIPLGHAQRNTNNSIHDLVKLPHFHTQPANLQQWMSTSLGVNHLQQQKPIQDFPSSFSDSGFPTGSSNGSFLNVMNNSPVLQTPQQKLSNGFSSQSSAGLIASNPDPFGMSAGVSTHLPDHRRSDETRRGSVSLPRHTTNTSLSNGSLCPSNIGDGILPIISHTENSLHNASSNRVVVSQSTLIKSDVGNIGNLPQGWKEQRQDQTNKLNLVFNSSSNSMHPNFSTMGAGTQNEVFVNGLSNKNMGTTVINQLNFSAPIYIENSIADSQLKLKEDYAMEHSTLEGGFDSNGYNSFDNLLNALVKQEHGDFSMDGDIGSDICSLDRCM